MDVSGRFSAGIPRGLIEAIDYVTRSVRPHHRDPRFPRVFPAASLKHAAWPMFALGEPHRLVFRGYSPRPH